MGMDAPQPEDLTECNFIKVEQISSTTPAESGYGANYSHGFVEPQFVDAIFSSIKPLKVLEIGPGEGRVLIKLLQDPRNKACSFTYHFAEISEEDSKKINYIYRELSKNSNNKVCSASREKYQGDARLFLRKTPQVYDLVLCSNVLHYFSPEDQLDVLENIHRVLAENGKAYLLQCSVYCINAWMPAYQDMRCFEEAHQEFLGNAKAGDLWPGYFCPSAISGKAGDRIIHSALASKQSKGINLHPTLHSKNSFGNLLKVVGFNIIDIKHFTEMTKKISKKPGKISSFTAPTTRIGAIVEKNNISPIDKSLLEEYRHQAQEKTKKVEARYAKFNESKAESDFNPGWLWVSLIQKYIAQKKEPDEALADFIGADLPTVTDIFNDIKRMRQPDTHLHG